jgi:hypothetical protein
MRWGFGTGENGNVYRVRDVLFRLSCTGMEGGQQSGMQIKAADQVPITDTGQPIHKSPAALEDAPVDLRVENVQASTRGAGGWKDLASWIGSQSPHIVARYAIRVGYSRELQLRSNFDLHKTLRFRIAFGQRLSWETNFTCRSLATSVSLSSGTRAITTFAAPAISVSPALWVSRSTL